MRIAAIILNLIMLGGIVFLFVTEGAPKENEAWLFLIPVIAAPLCSLIALFGSKGDSLLGLYFKRRALEEKKKIEDLSNRTQA